MRLLALCAWFVASLTSALAHPLLNDREASSYILGARTERELEALGIDRLELEPMFLEVIEGTRGEACAFSVNTALAKKLPEFPVLAGDQEQFLKAIRYAGIIDDVVLRLLLQAHYVQKDVKASAADELRLPEGELSAELRPLREFSLKRSRGKCLHENTRELMAAYRQQNSAFNERDLRRQMDAGLKAGVLTPRAHSELREALRDDVLSWNLSLAEYVQKRQFLRTQFPLPDATERSEFVTERAGKDKLSHRQRLYLGYTPLQITLMGDVIRKLKQRLESPRIEILVYDTSDEVREVLTLEPMERFRFAIRILRKEMKLLSINNYFAGRQPSYTDLMAAAYERGIVTSLELDEVAKLEEIWNPTRTFWDKAQVWVRMFGGVLAVVVPPPYGFLPSLAIVAIEAANQDPALDDQDSLF